MSEKNDRIRDSKFGPGNFNSFSGVDVKIMFAVPDGNGQKAIIKEMRNIQTLSYSLFREKAPVRALGFIGEKGKARGTRTIAGSIVFTVFDRHPLLDVMSAGFGDAGADLGQFAGIDSLFYTVPDQLPPFDIILHFANEYGFTSELVLFGVEIISEGQVQSVQDIITENTVQYTARHMVIMRPGGYLSAFDRGIDAMKAEARLPDDTRRTGGRVPARRTFESIMNQKEIPFRAILRTHNPLQ